jgi:hypothetical protein
MDADSVEQFFERRLQHGPHLVLQIVTLGGCVNKQQARAAKV